MNPSLPSALLVALLGLTPTSSAQEPNPQAAYLTIVNLITLPQPTHFTLSGFELNGGEALATGSDSGTLAIMPGHHDFTLVNPGASPDALSGSLHLEHGKSFAVICYNESQTLPDGSTTSILRYSLLSEGEQTNQPRLSLVSLLSEPFVSLDVSGKSLTLEGRLVHNTPREVGEAIQIHYKGHQLASFEITKAIHYLAFLFENPTSGKVEISLLRHETLEYQPPLSQKEP